MAPVPEPKEGSLLKYMQNLAIFEGFSDLF